jgi:phosphocarrier protein
VNGKSIMGVLTLAAATGTEITIEAHGDDEQLAMAALTQLINNRFGEDE